MYILCFIYAMATVPQGGFCSSKVHWEVKLSMRVEEFSYFPFAFHEYILEESSTHAHTIVQSSFPQDRKN